MNSRGKRLILIFLMVGYAPAQGRPLFGFPNELCGGFLGELRKENQDETGESEMLGILADFLEDNGDTARAELIRIDSRLASQSEKLSPKEKEALHDRRSKLIAQNYKKWVPKGTKSPIFRNGLLQEITIKNASTISVKKITNVFKSNPTLKFVFLPAKPGDNVEYAKLALRNAPVLQVGPKNQQYDALSQDFSVLTAHREGNTLRITSMINHVPRSRVLYGIYTQSGKLLKVVRGSPHQYHTRVTVKNLPERFSIKVIGGDLRDLPYLPIP